ncbi:MAG: hypothetical protein WKF84_06985 [Pyrinomonadaceae bacterium]
MALMRTGRIGEGRAAIEAAFEGDPFNIWAKNTLDLLDTIKDYKEVREGDFVVKIAASEHDTLSVYATGLLKEAAAQLNTKYRFKPQGPIQVELFPIMKTSQFARWDFLGLARSESVSAKSSLWIHHQRGLLANLIGEARCGMSTRMLSPAND